MHRVKGNIMKTKITSVLIAGITALTITPSFAKPHGGGAHGTDILHLSVKEALVNTGAESGTGTVQLSQNAQGNANKETLDVLLKGLTPSTGFSLMATTVSNSTPTDVQDFTTDAKGNAALHFRTNGKGKKNIALPPSIDPVSQITELDVVDTNTTQTVLTTSGATNNVVQYLVKRNLSNNDTTGTNSVTGQLMIKANSKSTQFSLKVSGLQPSTSYQLAFNGTTVDTETSDANGNLNFTTEPTPANILDLHTVALEDSSSNVILSTSLPQ